MRFMTLLVLLGAVVTSESLAAEARTYRIVDSEDRFFRFGGGLMAFNISARLQGTFEVVLEEDGSAHFSTFEVTLHDLLNEGTVDLGWMEGDRLEDRFNHPPTELEGEFEQQAGLDLVRFHKAEPIGHGYFLKSNITIQHLDAQVAALWLRSTYVVPQVDGLDLPIFDTPSMRTKVFDGPNGFPERQLLVQLVPEPGAAIHSGLGLLVILSASRSSRRRQSLGKHRSRQVP